MRRIKKKEPCRRKGCAVVRQLITKEQQKFMIDFMSNVNTNYTPEDLLKNKTFINDMWEDLSNKLNIIGPPCKTVTKWKLSWFKLRKSLAEKKVKKKRVKKKVEDEKLEKKPKIRDSNAKVIMQPSVTNEQINLLCEFVCQNSFLDGNGKAIKREMGANEIWNNFAKKLNNLGPPFKDTAGWRTIWHRKKHSSRQKYFRLRNADEEKRERKMTILDKRVIDFCIESGFIDPEADSEAVNFEYALDVNIDQILSIFKCEFPVEFQNKLIELLNEIKIKLDSYISKIVSAKRMSFENEELELKLLEYQILQERTKLRIKESKLSKN